MEEKERATTGRMGRAAVPKGSGLVVGEEALELVLVSVAVGLALAVAYHFLSVRLQSWFSRYSAVLLPLVFVVGFLIRLVVLAAVLVAVALWSPLNVVAVALSFIGLFTVLTGFWLYRMATKGRKTPPSAGGTSQGSVGETDAG